MWQRVQTLYLLIATVLVGLLFFCDKASYIGMEDPEGVSFLSYWPYAVLIIIVAVLHILALVGYKIRVFQMRTAMLSAIFCLALQLWVVYDYFVTAPEDLRFHITALFPLAVMILDLLAARSIFADELLVRSSSRLRSAKRRQR